MFNFLFLFLCEKNQVTNNQQKCGNANAQKRFFLMLYFSIGIIRNILLSALYMFRTLDILVLIKEPHPILVRISTPRYLKEETISTISFSKRFSDMEEKRHYELTSFLFF
jgi:hypothetical protein